MSLIRPALYNGKSTEPGQKAGLEKKHEAREGKKAQDKIMKTGFSYTPGSLDILHGNNGKIRRERKWKLAVETDRIFAKEKGINYE